MRLAHGSMRVTVGNRVQILAGEPRPRAWNGLEVTLRRRGPLPVVIGLRCFEGCVAWLFRPASRGVECCTEQNLITL